MPEHRDPRDLGGATAARGGAGDSPRTSRTAPGSPRRPPCLELRGGVSARRAGPGRDPPPPPPRPGATTLHVEAGFPASHDARGHVTPWGCPVRRREQSGGSRGGTTRGPPGTGPPRPGTALLEFPTTSPRPHQASGRLTPHGSTHVHRKAKQNNAKALGSRWANPHSAGFDHGFLDLRPKAPATKEKTGKSDFQVDFQVDVCASKERERKDNPQRERSPGPRSHRKPSAGTGLKP